MDSESKYKEMRDRIPGIKQLFQTRHYIQCATACERLLAQPNETHPVHQAYLNFYLALSHDTMAREAGMRNRHAELELAEEHYLAAISVLTPSETHGMKSVDESDSPTSSDSTYDLIHRRPSDAASLRSDHSTSTSATSLNSSVLETSEEPAISKRVTFATSQLGTPIVGTNVTSNPLKRNFTPIDTHSTSPASFQCQRLSTDPSAFVNMVKSHLAGVRELKDSPTPTTNRYSFTRPRYSTINIRPGSQASLHDEPIKEQVRWQRRSLSFRPRFDPTSVQKLCADALDEL